MELKSTVAAATLLLAIHFGANAQEIERTDSADHQPVLRDCHGMGCGYVRQISNENPYGIDWGWRGSASSSGVPTRALAMAKAQLLFAGEQCPKPSKLKKMTFQYLYLGAAGVRPKPDYMKSFLDAADKFKENYQAAWQTLDASKRDSFCGKYYEDATFNVKQFKLFPSEFYTQHLSPLSEEGILEFERKMERAEKVKWLAFFGQFLSLAAQVSAGHDAIQTGNSGLREGAQGNIGAMNSQMSQSRQLFSESTNFYNSGRYFGSVVSADPPAGALYQTSGAFSSALSCHTLDHFAKWNAPSDSGVWRTYQSLSTDCEALNQLRIR